MNYRQGRYHVKPTFTQGELSGRVSFGSEPEILSSSLPTI